MNTNASPSLFNRCLAICSIMALAIYALSCTAEPTAPEQSATPPAIKIVKAPINPNGDSELALLMRAMYEDAAQMKAAIDRGETPKPSLDHEALLTAAATEPEKAASPTYQVHARSYLQALKGLQQADAPQAAVLFKGMVDSCMGCHTALCPGPRVRIKKLY